MKISHVCLLLAGAGLFASACSAENDSGRPGTGGSGASGGASGSGASGGSISSGGSAAGGAPGGGGHPSTGGSASGGAAGEGTHPGGAGGTTPGSGGSGSGEAGAGGGSTTATPSEGCNKGAGRPAGGSVSVANSHYFAFPEGYDGTTPLPVLFGFHGCSSGNRGTSIDNTQWMNLTRDSSFASAYVRAIPVSESGGGCWSYDTDIPRVKRVYDELIANHCVDTSRIFATGHSSGAQFIVQVVTTRHTEDADHLNFKALAPVAASDYGPIAGPVPVLYIQGQRDAERNNGDGRETVARFRAANTCDESSTPYTSIMGCQSGGTMVDPGCRAYEGCAAPTIWCSHNDPNYGGTMHGVPCFALRAMYDFFEGLP